MERIDGQIGDSGQLALEVDWRERVTVHYKLVPIEKEGNICLLSKCPFSNAESSVTPSALSSSGDYLCLEKTNARFQVCMHRLQSPNTNRCQLSYNVIALVLHTIRERGRNTKLIY
jgi:hypothetical protein